MKRKIVIALLAFGTLGGFASGLCSKGGCRAESRRAAYERHVARLCVEAALEARPAPPPAAE